MSYCDRASGGRALGEFRVDHGSTLFVPKGWWRWQAFYLRSTPATRAIVACFTTPLT